MALTIVPVEKSDMLEKVINFPTQVSEAYGLSKDLDFPCSASNILLLGMGGSGIIGDYLRVMLRNSPLPVHVCKSPHIPAFVSKDTLVIAVTYSGKTLETLEAMERCMRVGARIVSFTSGQELKLYCDRKGIRCVSVPKNGQTRASLGYILIPVLSMLNNAGIIPRSSFDVRESVDVLNGIRDECKPDIPVKKNPARSLAMDLLDRFPVVYGQHNFTDVVALRWKQQFNENSKVHCYFDTFPELLHNEIEAWDTEGSVYENYALVLLRDSISEREIGIQGKVRATKFIVQQKGSRMVEFWSRGRSELARLLSLTYIGDYSSVYLAIAKGVDPSLIQNIEFVKSSTSLEGRMNEER
jgi:glucose/mannose-6-phosphate isomerase